MFIQSANERFHQIRNTMIDTNYTLVFPAYFFTTLNDWMHPVLSAAILLSKA